MDRAGVPKAHRHLLPLRVVIMKYLPLIVLLMTACTTDVFGPSDAAPPQDAAPTEDHHVGVPLPEAGPIDAGPEACTPVAHWNGYNTFYDCTPLGVYTQDLALTACTSYFGDGGSPSCGVLDTDAGWCTGYNVVGAKTGAWIVWDWFPDTGTGWTKESPGTPPDCPNFGSILPWQ